MTRRWCERNRNAPVPPARSRVDDSAKSDFPECPVALEEQSAIETPAAGQTGVMALLKRNRLLLDAYDAVSGDRLWRLWTIPGPGTPGHETWAGESWKTGGVATWLTDCYDGDNPIYWGTGNPALLVRRPNSGANRRPNRSQTHHI